MADATALEGRRSRPFCFMIEYAFITVFNRLLKRAPWARQRLQPHAGLLAKLDAQPISVMFEVTAEGMLQSSAKTNPDVVLTLPLAELGQFAAGQVDAAMRSVHIQGNAEFADALGFVFRNLRWDAEEELAQIVGDVAAHRLANTGRAIVAAQRRMVESVAGNLVEYLTEERPMLVPRALNEQFADALRALRDAVARTEKRIDRLQTRVHGKTQH